MDNATYELTFL